MLFSTNPRNMRSWLRYTLLALLFVALVGLTVLIAVFSQLPSHLSWQIRLFYTFACVFNVKHNRAFIRYNKDPKVEYTVEQCRKETRPPKSVLRDFKVVEAHASCEHLYYIVRHGVPMAQPAIKCILYYAHGGSYLWDIDSQHWMLSTRIMRALRESGIDCTLVLPSYPLAPLFTYRHGVRMMRAVYKDVCAMAEREGAAIVAMGDSAGGGIMTGLLQMQDDCHPRLRALVLLSPWLDVTMSDPRSRTIEAVDPLLLVDLAIEDGKRYSPASDTTDDIRASPICPLFGSFHALPEDVYVFSGTYDILHPQSPEFVKRYEKQMGRRARFHSYDAMCHDWVMVSPFWLPEADHALAEIVADIQRSVKK
jgi:monoterpene epsilon-lactone hydrolase